MPRIEDAEWTPLGNMLIIRCDCGDWYKHRADRWKLRCQRCGQMAHLQELREEYVERMKCKDTA